MKILVVSNLYPPSVIGGYEIACRDFSEGLAALGHQLLILTSSYQSKQSVGKVGGLVVTRRLNFNDPRKIKNRFLKKWVGLGSVYFDLKNFILTLYYIKKFRPDLVYFWNLSFLSVAPILAVHFSGRKFVFQLGDYWLTTPLKFGQHQEQGWLEEGIKKILSRWFPKILASAPFITVSRYIFDYYLGLGLERNLGAVIYNGLKLNSRQLLRAENIKSRLPPERLLYVGRIIADKGLHLVVEALGQLQNQGRRFELDVVGEWGDEGYRRRLEDLVKRYGLSKQIRFLGKKSREEVLRLYRQYRFLVVPSVWGEPFGLIVIEAMSRGCVPIVSDAGALPELVKPGQDGFVFAKDNAAALARRLRILRHEDFAGLSKRAQAAVAQKFMLDDKVKEVAQCL